MGLHLVNAGLHGLGHSVRDRLVDDELIRVMKQKGAWLSATTLTREYSVFTYAHQVSEWMEALQIPRWSRNAPIERKTSSKSWRGLPS